MNERLMLRHGPLIEGEATLRREEIDAFAVSGATKGQRFQCFRSIAPYSPSQGA